MRNKKAKAGADHAGHPGSRFAAPKRADPKRQSTVTPGETTRGDADGARPARTCRFPRAHDLCVNPSTTRIITWNGPKPSEVLQEPAFTRITVADGARRCRRMLGASAIRSGSLKGLPAVVQPPPGGRPGMLPGCSVAMYQGRRAGLGTRPCGLMYRRMASPCEGPGSSRFADSSGRPEPCPVTVRL
jgi:hypothetical protein